MKSLIYKHTCTITNKSYIGQTTKTLEQRFKEHLNDSVGGSSTHFHKALRKYGKENFISEILEDNIKIASDINSKTTLQDLREIHYIEKHDTFSNGYNMTGGGSIRIGYKPSEETKVKISKSLVGKKRPQCVKEAISKGQQNMSSEAKAQKSRKCSVKKKGVKQSKSHVEANRNAFKVSGEDHGCAKIIQVFDKEGQIRFEFNGRFENGCKEKGLPCASLKKSYQNNGKRILTNVNGYSKSFLTKYSKFIGWYALSKV